MTEEENLNILDTIDNTDIYENTRYAIVNPTVVTKIVNITKFVFSKILIKLNVSAEITIDLLDDKNSYYESKTFLISGSEYENWADDDNYIVNLINEKLNNGC